MKRYFFILLILFCLKQIILSQSVTYINESFSAPIKSEEKDSLQGYVNSINLNLKDSIDFNLIVGTYYQLSEHMGDHWIEIVEQNLISKANAMSNSNLVVGRYYDFNSNGYKMRIKLNLNSSDLFCYTEEQEREIDIIISDIKTKIKQYNEYLNGSLDLNGNDNMLLVVEYVNQLITNSCCVISNNRTQCDPDVKTNFEQLKEDEAKYFILGRIKCIYYGEYGSNCGSTFPLSNEDPLYNITSEVLNDGKSILNTSDKLLGIGFVQIETIDHLYTISCDLNPTSLTKSIYYGNTSRSVEMYKYNLGRFIIYTEKENLHDYLKLLNSEILNELPDIAKRLRNKTELSGKSLDLLNFVSPCELLEISSTDKFRILTGIISHNDEHFNWFWRMFSENYPNFIFEIYNSINSKDCFFAENEKEPKFINNVLDYIDDSGFKTEIMKKYIGDYISHYLKIEDNNIRIRNSDLAKIPQITYDTEKILGFVNGSHDFEELNGKINITQNYEFKQDWHNQLFNWLFNTKRQVRIASELDLLSPVSVYGISLQDLTQNKGIFPAVLLLHLNQKEYDENLVNGVMLSIDALTTLSVIGNALKLRHLGKLKYILAVESSSTVVNNIVKYTNVIPNDTLRNTIISVLTMIEVSASVASFKVSRLAAHASKAERGIVKQINSGGLSAEEISGAEGALKIIKSTIGVKNLLLERLKTIIDVNSDLYKFVSNSASNAKLNGLSKLSDDVLIKASKLFDNNSNITKFVDDLNNNSKGYELIKFLNGKSSGVKAWKIVDDIGTNAAWRRSPEFLQKVLSILDDSIASNAIKALGTGTPAEEFSKLLKGIQAAPCSVCGTTSTSRFRDVTMILSDIEHVAQKLPGYGLNNLMGQLKRTDSAPGLLRLKEGIAFELRQVVIKNNPNAVYGQQIPNALHGSKFDMKSGSKLDEFKSTTNITGELYNDVSPINKLNQLYDYFGGINKADDLGITFDSKSLGGDLNFAKTEMASVIESYKPEIFGRMSDQFKLDIGITNVNDITQFDSGIIGDLINVIIHVD